MKRLVGISLLLLASSGCDRSPEIKPEPSRTIEEQLQGASPNKRVLTASTDASRLRSFFIASFESEDPTAQIVEHLIDGPFVITSAESPNAFVDLGGDCSYDPTGPSDDEFSVATTGVNLYVPPGAALCAVRTANPFQPRSYLSGYIPY